MRVCLILLLVSAVCTAAAYGSTAASVPTPSGAPAPTSVGDPSAAAHDAFLAQQRAELDTMPAPEGVDLVTWQELKAALAAELVPGKTAALAPGTAASGPRLEYSAGQLTWNACMQGDYDQNGEVNVADLVPLSLNFKRKSASGGPFHYANALSVVDGDGNGEINIADLQAIGLNLGRRVQDWALYSSPSFSDLPSTPTGPNGPTATLLLTIANTMTGSPAQDRLTEVFSQSSPPGMFLWIRAIDGTSVGPASNVVTAGGSSGDSVPTLILHFSNGVSGPAPFTETFDASSSADSDGQIVQFQWDLDGDGSYEIAGTDSVETYTYSKAGTYPMNVRIYDNHGALTTFNQPITITVTP